MSFHRSLQAVGFLVAWLLGFGGISASAADRPSWQCLPEETIFVVRLPNLAHAFDALKMRTKLGAVLTNEQRLDDLTTLLESEAGDDWQNLKVAYEKLGLSWDDLRPALEGEIGYGGLLADDDGSTRYVGLAWLECGDGTAEKWLAALDRRLSEQESGPAAVRREDIDLAGRKVSHLIIPHTKPKPGSPTTNGAINKPPTAAELDLKSEAKPAETELVEVGQTHLLIGRRTSGLLVTHAAIVYADEKEETASKRRRESAAVTETLRNITARFIEAHSGRDEGVVQRWRQTPGLDNALPEGDVVLDVLVDVRRLVARLHTPEAEEAWAFVKAAGFDAVGPLAYRMALDGTLLRSGLFLSAPAPRVGLQPLVDQPPLKPEPAGWVNKTAVGYQHFSIDLGKAYGLVTRIVRETVPRGVGMLDTLETQSQAFLQIDPASLLSALGKTHIMLSYLPQTDEEAARRSDDAAAQTATAFVWQVPDEAVWRRLMSLLAKASARPLDTEQGFTGLRYDEKEFSGGWFIGNGYMTLALGRGVTERVLANLRSTPRSDETLRNAPHARRAAELLPPTGAITYDLTDGAGLLHFADTMMRRAFAEATDEDAAKLKQLWPNEEELSGTIGVSVSATTVDADGVTYRSILELPSP